jgi:hypothetical protein
MLAAIDAWMLQSPGIKVESPLSTNDALASLVGLTRGRATNPYAETLFVEVIGAEVLVRYRRLRSETAFNALMNALRCVFRGRIEPSADGCCLRGRFALPWLNVSMIFVGVAVLVSSFPSSIVPRGEVYRLLVSAVFYGLVAVPIARADVPFIERNIRYALTGSNDGG